MGREDPQLKLRLTEDMKDAVTAAARESGRSVNAEIVARLAKSFEGDFVSSDDLTGIRSSFHSMVETSEKLVAQLTAVTQREKDLHETISRLAKGLAESNAMSERMLKMLEAQADVSQKA